jgi:ribbon-helix-helix CopG family protein
MTDVLIRNVPEDDLARIDEQAARLGLSRGEYLRRRIIQEAHRPRLTVTRADFERFAALSQDLLDDDVMRDAWG